jgi:predicted O-methyltransferase YrrM
MELKELDQKIRNTELDMSKIFPYLQYVEAGAMNDIIGEHSTYYRYLARLVEYLKPKQIVEMGSAAGVADLMMLSHLPLDSHLYACSIPEPEGEFRYIKGDYPNLTMIHGDDLDLRVWGDIKLNETDVWFIDTDHNYDQLHAELTLYDQFFKKGALVLLDDIHLNPGMERAWNEIKYDKIELNDLHSYKNTGYGMFRV